MFECQLKKIASPFYRLFYHQNLNDFWESSRNILLKDDMKKAVEVPQKTIQDYSLYLPEGNKKNLLRNLYT